MNTTKKSIKIEIISEFLKFPKRFPDWARLHVTSERGEPTIAVPVYKNRRCSKYFAASYIVKMVKSCVAVVVLKLAAMVLAFSNFLAIQF